MKKYLVIGLLTGAVIMGCGRVENNIKPGEEIIKLSAADSTLIMNTFMLTEDAWNSGDLEEFMKGYIVSDRLVFVGSRGPTYGYKSTLESYKRGYPDLDAMGKLKFDIVDLYQVDTKTVIMIGKFYLTRIIGDMQGYYTLVWQKIEGKWLIISDHSSGEEVQN